MMCCKYKFWNIYYVIKMLSLFYLHIYIHLLAYIWYNGDCKRHTAIFVCHQVQIVESDNYILKNKILTKRLVLSYCIIQIIKVVQVIHNLILIFWLLEKCITQKKYSPWFNWSLQYKFKEIFAIFHFVLFTWFIFGSIGYT